MLLIACAASAKRQLLEILLAFLYLLRDRLRLG